MLYLGNLTIAEYEVYSTPYVDVYYRQYVLD